MWNAESKTDNSLLIILRSSLDFFVRRVFPARATILVPLQTVRIILLVLHRRIVSFLAHRTSHRDDVPHFFTPRQASGVRGSPRTASPFRLTPKPFTSLLRQDFRDDA